MPRITTENPLLKCYGEMLRTNPRLTHCQVPGKGIYRRDPRSPNRWINDRGGWMTDESMAGYLERGAWARVEPGALGCPGR